MSLKREILLFNPNTRENVRKEFDLDKQGAMDQAIEILQNWIQKQDHFVKKDFPRQYLEGFLVASKGSVEKTKQRLDRICTLRTTVPYLFEKCNAKKDFPNLREYAHNILMPKPTEDDYRIHIVKIVSKQISAAANLNAFQHNKILLEYGKMNDYVKGYYSIFDLEGINILDGMKNLDLIDLRNNLAVATEGHAVRIMGIFVISSSKMISTFINLLKQFLSTKIGEKIHIVKNVESLYEVLPRKLLPKDYGGEQKSILEIFDDFIEEFSSEKHVAFMEEINQACTNEKLRRTDSFNQEHLGMPGSFKVLSLD